MATSTERPEQVHVLEKAYLQAETEWLRTQEMPFVLKELQKNLINCSDCLGNKKEKVGDDILPERKYLDYGSRLISFETPLGNLKGFVSIEGWIVKEAELNLKINKNVLKTKITNLHPWILSQIQNAYNYIQMARSELNNLLQEIMTNHSLSYFQKGLDEISTLITKARQDLILPNKNRFPTKLLMPHLIFQPQLPQDVIIEIGVRNNQLVVTAYVLTAKSKRSPSHQILSPGNVPNTEAIAFAPGGALLPTSGCGTLVGSIV
eukprot:TRINITY_DN2963_c0_g1_i2.p1 TRINITY_DN2963_c0_g1~~TRINITY_DN2963_c0_g1_i2.p1  ORF type:complete len:263 (+),score=43.73 TRINITY_DN2963_c0_g1_i2:56-844(+)